MKAIFYTDGSCKPNPGFGGFGYFGYSFISSKKPTKFPNEDLYFTSRGIEKEKENIEVKDIYEYIEFIQKETTNNHAELYSFIKALEKINSLDLEEVTIFSDSNYIVSNIEIIETWKNNNWRRVDSKELIHINEWIHIYDLLQQIKSKNIQINIQWVKGHSNNYGNELADFYSAIGSNAATLNSKQNNSNTIILDQSLTFKDFKESFYDKDIVMNFKDMFYNPFIENATFHFLANFENESLLVGRKNTESIFAVNVGYIPEYISKIKNFIKNLTIQENFYTIKIAKLKDKNKLRIFKYIDLQYILMKNKSGYKIVSDDTDLIYPLNYKFPLITNVSKTFNFMVESYLNVDKHFTFDITNILYENKKCNIKNSDIYIDISDKINLPIINSFKLEIGKDIPSYIVLNNLKDEIKKVTLVVELCYETNTASFYTIFNLQNRDLITCHTLNKYFLRKN